MAAAAVALCQLTIASCKAASRRHDPAAGATVVGQLPEREASAIPTLMRRIMAQAHIPGAAVAIVRNGKVEWMSTYGSANTEYNVKVVPETPFQIASATKIYTAVLLLRMIEQHKLSLDDPVTKYIPNAPPEWRKITIRNLATHTSGLGPSPVDASVITAAQALPFIFKGKPIAAPGERAAYSSPDFTPLQYVLEKVGGKSFEQLLHDEVLVPAGMRCTTFDYAVEFGPQRIAYDIPGRAEYYRWSDTVNQRRWFLYAQYAYAGGGVYSCVRDMATLIAALDAGTLLSPASMALIETPARLNSGTSASFSVGLTSNTYRGKHWVGHSGGPAFSDVMYFPGEHLGIVVFTNQQRLYPEIASLIADQMIPAPSNYTVGVRDDFPALTSTLRTLLGGIAKGTVDGSLLVDADRESTVADLDEVGPVWVGLLGPITRIVLVSDAAAPDGGRLRRYRVMFGAHGQGIDATFDKHGKISDFQPNGD